jgi:NitT/TauT family transport system permease protein
MTLSRLRRIKTGREIPQTIILKIILPIIILLVLWSVIVFISSDGYLTIVDVVESFIKLTFEGDSEGRTLLYHTTTSLFRVILGFAVAFITAVPLGVAVGRYRKLNSIASPVIEAMRPIPPIAWIPLAILLFSPVFLYAQVFIIWIGVFFPLLINTTSGVKRTNPVHLDVAETFGASEVQVLRRIVIPSAAPEIFSGMRIGFGIGWMCLVAAEMIPSPFGVVGGLGYLILLMQQSGRTGGVISGMLLIGFIGFFINFLFLYLEKHLLKWRQEVAI